MSHPEKRVLWVNPPVSSGGNGSRILKVRFEAAYSFWEAKRSVSSKGTCLLISPRKIRRHISFTCASTLSKGLGMIQKTLNWKTTDSFISNRYVVRIIKQTNRGICVVQLVKRSTLGFCSGHDLRVLRLSPVLGSAQSSWVSFLLLLPPSLLLPCALSNNQINKKTNKTPLNLRLF